MLPSNIVLDHTGYIMSFSTHCFRLHRLHGSPTLKYILLQIRDYLLSAGSTRSKHKIIIAEDTPVIAWFYERVLNHMNINTKVLAAYLNPEERKQVVKDFNDPVAALEVLIVIQVYLSLRIYSKASEDT